MVNTKLRIIVVSEKSGGDMGSSINTQTALMQDISLVRLSIFWAG